MSRMKYEEMTVAELMSLALENNISLMGARQKLKIIDVLEAGFLAMAQAAQVAPAPEAPVEDEAPEDGEEVEEVDEEAEQMPHVIKYEQRVAALREAMSSSAMGMAHTKKDAKVAKDTFESYTNQLCDLIDTGPVKPEPTLFGDATPKRCRECDCTEDDDHFFATDDLCQYCADNLDSLSDEEEESDEEAAEAAE